MPKVKLKVKLVPAPNMSCVGCIAEHRVKMCSGLPHCGSNIYVLKEKK